MSNRHNQITLISKVVCSNSEHIEHISNLAREAIEIQTRSQMQQQQVQRNMLIAKKKRLQASQQVQKRGRENYSLRQNSLTNSISLTNVSMKDGSKGIQTIPQTKNSFKLSIKQPAARHSSPEPMNKSKMFTVVQQPQKLIAGRKKIGVLMASYDEVLRLNGTTYEEMRTVDYSNLFEGYKSRLRVI